MRQGWSWRRLGRVAILLGASAFGLGTGPAAGQGEAKPAGRVASLFDPRLSELRRASVAWENREGPDRRVVDLLCLVPDVPTFLEAVGAWDRGRFFPILLDEPETALKFARVFRPSRVVRYPRRAAPIPPEKLWGAAVEAVGRSWAEPPKGPLKGDAAPSEIGPTTPGVVLSAPEAPGLAGAVALAAGRFQPLVRWEPRKRRSDVLSSAEAENLAIDLEAKVAATVPDYVRLGDDCDFLTLAGDWPDRYQADRPPLQGLAAFDDLIGRDLGGARRWAFAGRLGGDAATSVYRAMCGLFLRPRSVLLFNGYSESDEPWKSFGMAEAARRLRPDLVVAHRSGPDDGGIIGWHRAFGARSPFDLVLVNTSGSPSAFNIRGGTGQTGDVPTTVPAAALVIHSFSAVDPSDPATLAGRWLANGAFVYFGAMNEPYLDAFRTPTLAADLIASGLPLSAVARVSASESLYARPWRLHYLGDPLFRLRREVPRIEPGPAFASWPSLGPGPPPAEGSEAARRLDWAERVALTGKAPPRLDLPAFLLAIRRESLPPALRPRYDALLADALFSADRLTDLRDRLGRIAPGESSPDVRRWLETARVSDLHTALDGDRWASALDAWAELIRSDSPAELKSTITARVAARAGTPDRRRSWADRLRSTRDDLGPQSPIAAELSKELSRVEDWKGKG